MACVRLRVPRSALTLNLPSVYVAFDRLVGEPNLGELVVHALVLLAGWAAQGAIVHFRHEPPAANLKIKRRGVVLVAALGAMTWFFIRAPLDVETTEFTTAYANAPYVVEYWLAYLSFLGFALADVARMSWRYSRPAGGLVGAGLRVLAVGSASGLVYVAHKATYVGLRRWTDVDVSSGWHTAASRSAMVLCVVLAAFGTTLPRWGPGFARMLDRIHHLRTHRRLRPLWESLAVGCPDRVLVRHPRGWIDAWNLNDIDFRLYRRIIEIRDAQLELRPFADEEAAAVAREAAFSAGLRGRKLAAAVEAGALRAALLARRAGRAPSGWQAVQQVEPADLTEESEWLLEIARFFDRPPGDAPAISEQAHA